MEVHLIIRGRVQGVQFRKSLKKEAKKLQLTGFVENKPDGSVFFVAQGDKESLIKFITFAQVGPITASIDEVLIKWMKPVT